jgi:hypothetical protein
LFAACFPRLPFFLHPFLPLFLITSQNNVVVDKVNAVGNKGLKETDEGDTDS